MASIAKVKKEFQHKGKTYKAGDNFEGEEHEIQTLAAQGHLEHPLGSQTIGQQHGAGGQAQEKPGEQSQQQSGPHDPSKQR